MSHSPPRKDRLAGSENVDMKTYFSLNYCLIQCALCIFACISHYLIAFHFSTFMIDCSNMKKCLDIILSNQSFL